MTTTPLQTASAYYQTSPGTRWLRWALGLSERVWPALAVRGAYRLFGTPLPPKWLHRRQPALGEHAQDLVLGASDAERQLLERVHATVALEEPDEVS